MDNNIDMSRRIAAEVSKRSGTAYYVGGYVRDLLRNTENKDIDIEIHGIAPSEVEKILDSLGKRISIGESFGIYALKGYSIDIALPRKDKLIGEGHRDFEIMADPFIGAKQAARRRDFTVNAIMQNILTGEISDFFGGREDLKNKILRHVDTQSFPEDPLRVLRAAQFAARFGFTIAEETISLCRKTDIKNLSKERVADELFKALLQSEKPSAFFKELRRMDALDHWFAEAKDLIGIEQNPAFHAEGDVWNHTMLVLDAAAQYRGKAQNPRGFMLSALTHDFGKAVTTKFTDGRIRSLGHETEGLPVISEFLRRITNEKEIIKYVLNMARYHMEPNKLAAAKASVKATNRLFDKSCSPLDLIYLAASDDQGRIKQNPEGTDIDFLLERLDIYEETMARPYVTGKDLIEAGLLPDEGFAAILAYAHKLRLAGIEKENALKQTLAFAKSIKD